MSEKPRSSGRAEPFAAVLYSEPGALGLLANIMSALIVAIGNMIYGYESELSLIVAGAHLILIGGFLQYVAGLLSFRRNDHLTGTAFIVFAGLWSFQGILYLLSKKSSVTDLAGSALPGLIGFITVAIVLLICSLFVNYIMPPVLGAMLLTLIFESVGLYFLWGKRVAAAFEIFIALTAIYAVVVMTTKGVSQRYVFPGFGNSVIDPLLIPTVSRSKKKNERKKNTKYAEPMGMGYIGNIVPPVVLCFYHLGYFADFLPAMCSLLCSVLCHIMASYYSFLRHDYYHAVQFITYFIFWMSRGSDAFLKSLEVADDGDIQHYFGSWGIVVLLVILSVVSLTQSLIVFLYNLLMTVTAVLSLEHIPSSLGSYMFGISSAIFGLFSLYLSVAHLLNSIAEKTVVYVGPELISMEQLKSTLSCCTRSSYNQQNENLRSSDDDKDDDIVETVTFLGNMIAALALSPYEVTGGKTCLPWLLVSGTFLNLFAGRLSYASGSLAKSFTLCVLASVWGTWSAVLFGGISIMTIRGSAIGVLCLHTVAMMMSPVFSRLRMVFALVMELNIISLLLNVYDVRVSYMTLVTALVVGAVCLYGTTAGLLNGTLEETVLPQGDPILKVKSSLETEIPCKTIPSRSSAALLRAAKLLNDGEVIGVPTDTVYALASSCKHPQSVTNIYNIKGRPPEKPICLCVADVNQLQAANPPFSPLLWRFMELCYPGGITCVVRKGDWLRTLGVGDAIDYIGTKESVAIRVPDSTVLSYLVSITGPVALTSANPSGEPDSLHHDMVIDSLGHKLGAVVCDDESNETVASTVVSCLKIDDGEISYFRIGCTPKEKVDLLFEQAKADVNKDTIKA